MKVGLKSLHKAITGSPSALWQTKIGSDKEYCKKYWEANKHLVSDDFWQNISYEDYLENCEEWNIISKHKGNGSRVDLDKFFRKVEKEDVYNQTEKEIEEMKENKVREEEAIEIPQSKTAIESFKEELKKEKELSEQRLKGLQLFVELEKIRKAEKDVKIQLEKIGIMI